MNSAEPRYLANWVWRKTKLKTKATTNTGIRRRAVRNHIVLSSREPRIVVGRAYPSLYLCLAGPGFIAKQYANAGGVSCYCLHWNHFTAVCVSGQNEGCDDHRPRAPLHRHTQIRSHGHNGIL